MTFEDCLEEVAKTHGFQSFDEARHYKGDVDKPFILMKIAAKLYAEYWESVCVRKNHEIIDLQEENAILHAKVEKLDSSQYNKALEDAAKLADEDSFIQISILKLKK